MGRRTAPLAALALFSVHGTAVPMSSRTHNADLWGYLCAELGQRVAQTHGPVRSGRGPAPELAGAPVDLAIRRHLPEPPTSAIELVQYQAPETPDRRGWQSLGDPAWGQLRGEPCLQWCWSGAAPERMTWHRPVVALELPDGRVVTDAHGELEVEYQPRRRSRLHTYARFTLSSRRG